ncbi:bifunctional 2-polyprenyl-6-hydroxyphenol methylase/3-demethylubiquinol 3-O-methyltransferase UbiG [Nocardioides sp. SR21]|uniref:class I SAM-dependent methyltransferase n=1 Tax=Nocardioides sp. SR21 TaxID=2919501 RepID=UPI001FA96839|nr:class I SAM-dependent methyltransferase [Nocardioides sp. SR21]
MSTRWERIARETAGEDYAREYAERFRALAARGEDVHGEAAFLEALVRAPARVLDAGCGTGRIAVRLRELGYDVVGVDVDIAMLWVAAGDKPEIEWLWADLSTLDLEATFDVVLVAGNTIPLLEEGTLAATCERLAAHTEPGGLVICGFGLDEAHLPPGCPVTTLTDFQAAMALAGLDDVVEFSSWDRGEFDPAGGYVVSVHQRPEE